MTLLAASLWMCAAALAELPIVQARDFTGLLQMEQACAVAGGPCVLEVSTPQVITLTQAHALPAGMQVRFDAGGRWTVDGATLTISSGVVEAAEDKQIFAGSAEIRGLANARPEWFTAPVAVYPASAMARAYRSTVVWGTVLLRDAVYLSSSTNFAGGQCGNAVYDTPRRFVGSLRPHVDDESAPHELVGGSVIRGQICATAPLQMVHLGVDVGPQVVQQMYHGATANGIYLPNRGRYNPKRGTQLKDVSVLTNRGDGEHSVLIEGEEGALVDGLWIWTTGGTHGLVLKSAHSEVRDFHCRGASSDCLLIKSDYRTDGDGYASEDRLKDIDIRYLAKPGDTGGIAMDASWDNISGVSFDRVREDGLQYGFASGGSWFYGLKDISIDHWSAQGLTGPCMRFYDRSQVLVRDSSCAGVPQAAEKRSFFLRLEQFWSEVKRHLRIVWTTLCTWCERIVASMHRR